MLAIPEYKVPLPPYQSRASQNDLFVLAKASAGDIISMMVEGKVSEPFGLSTAVWGKAMKAGKAERLQFLLETLELGDSIPPTIRYQLLHRSVSAVLEAQKFNAKYAVMLVHSFSGAHQWFEDFQAFLNLFGIVDAAPDRLYSLRNCGGIQLFSGWVTGNPAFLAS